VRAVTKLTQINLSYRGLHSDVPPVCCEVSRALTRRGLATLARLRTEATLLEQPAVESASLMLQDNFVLGDWTYDRPIRVLL